MLVIHLLALKHGNAERISLAGHFGSPRGIASLFRKEFRLEDAVQSDNAFADAEHIVCQIGTRIDDCIRFVQTIVEVTAAFELSLQSRNRKLDSHENRLESRLTRRQQRIAVLEVQDSEASSSFFGNGRIFGQFARPMRL